MTVQVPPPTLQGAFVGANGVLTRLGHSFLDRMWRRTGGNIDAIGQAAPTGTICAFAGSTAPDGWGLCLGQEASRTGEAALFAVIGVTYGAGDGSTTFNLPNGQNRMMIGAGSLALGATGGAASVTIGQANLPAYNLTVTDAGHSHGFAGTPHGHSVTDPGHDHTVTDPGHTHSTAVTASNGTAGGAAGATAGSTGSATTGVSVDSNTTGVTVDDATAGGTVASAATGITVASGGSGTALDTLPPYFVGNWIIKL